MAEVTSEQASRALCASSAVHRGSSSLIKATFCSLVRSCKFTRRCSSPAYVHAVTTTKKNSLGPCTRESSGWALEGQSGTYFSSTGGTACDTMAAVKVNCRVPQRSGQKTWALLGWMKGHTWKV